MDAFELSTLKQTDIKTQMIVFGFLRLTNNQLQQTPIPDLVGFVVLSYYRRAEFLSRCSEKMCIEDEGTKVIGCGNCYGNISISYASTLVHEWQIQILKKKYVSSVRFGFDEDPGDQHPLSGGCFCYNPQGKNYAFRSDGYIWKSDEASEGFSGIADENDTMTMKYNGKDKSLWFSINEQTAKEAYKIEPNEVGYRMCVYLLDDQDEIKLLSYCCHK